MLEPPSKTCALGKFAYDHRSLKLAFIMMTFASGIPTLWLPFANLGC